MKVIPLRSVLWAAAAVAMAAAVALTVATLRDLKAAAGRLKQKAGDLADLNALGESAAQYRAAQQVFERMAEDAAPASFEQAVLVALPDRQPEDIRRQRESFRAGWVVERVEISLPELPFKALAPLVQTAEALRPPWTLTKCVLSGSPRAAGSGRATLQFERISRE